MQLDVHMKCKIYHTDEDVDSESSGSSSEEEYCDQLLSDEDEYSEEIDMKREVKTFIRESKYTKKLLSDVAFLRLTRCLSGAFRCGQQSDTIETNIICDTINADQDFENETIQFRNKDNKLIKITADYVDKFYSAALLNVSSHFSESSENWNSALFAEIATTKNGAENWGKPGECEEKSEGGEGRDDKCGSVDDGDDVRDEENVQECDAEEKGDDGISEENAEGGAEHGDGGGDEEGGAEHGHGAGDDGGAEHGDAAGDEEGGAEHGDGGGDGEGEDEDDKERDESDKEKDETTDQETDEDDQDDDGDDEGDDGRCDDGYILHMVHRVLRHEQTAVEKQLISFNDSDLLVIFLEQFCVHHICSIHFLF